MIMDWYTWAVVKMYRVVWSGGKHTTKILLNRKIQNFICRKGYDKVCLDLSSMTQEFWRHVWRYCKSAHSTKTTTTKTTSHEQTLCTSLWSSVPWQAITTTLLLTIMDSNAQICASIHSNISPNHIL